MDCMNCDIKKKLCYCCGNHPSTEESKTISIGGVEVKVCLNLDTSGRCETYANRPRTCKKFDCTPYVKEEFFTAN